MKNSLSVSVITPSLNQGRFIRHTIDSVLKQNIHNIEHIIIDGGSTDETISILKQYPHLKWISQPDRGQSDAINKGFAMSCGNLIAWINSDDYYLPGALQAVCELFQANPHVSLLSGNTVFVDEHDNITFRTAPTMTKWRLFHPWHNGTGIFQPGTIFRREVFEQCGPLDITLQYAMDYDFFLKAVERFAIHHLERDIACFRSYDESKTGHGYGSFRKERKRVLLRHLHKKNLSKTIWSAICLHIYNTRQDVEEAIGQYQLGCTGQARRLLFKACLANPMSLLCYPHLCFRLRQILGTALYEHLRKKFHAIHG
jgi:glycosyltransferase involved in cell wall biosynthesis